jgi:hypothetical protein
MLLWYPPSAYQLRPIVNTRWRTRGFRVSAKAAPILRAVLKLSLQLANQLLEGP